MQKFGNFEFDVDGAGLTQAGEVIALEPQAIRLLAYLIEHRDRVVSKDELIEKIWDGRAISDTALNTRIRAVRRALGDGASDPRFIKTYPKRGFQFIAVIEGAPVAVAEPAANADAPPKRGRRLWGAGIAAAVVAVAVGLWAYIGGQSGPELDGERPSLAVIQFDNLGDQTDAQYFVDGLTDDLIAHLSRYRELFVVSRATMLSYADADASPVEIARDLGVDYVVRGSVRRAGDAVRVSGELIHVDGAETIWAETFDRRMEDFFMVQDELSQAIAGRLLPEIYLADAEEAQDTPTADMGAWDLYLRGRVSQAVYSKDAQEDAIEFAEAALERDPAFAAAHSLMARAYGTMFFFQWADNPPEALALATEAAKRAIELDDRDAQAHAALGYIYRFTGKSDLAIANLERAVALNPNDARIRLEMAHTFDWFRLQDQALPQIDMALELSPRDPLLQNMYFYKGHILFHLERHEEALVAAREMGAVATSNTWRMFHHLLRAANLIELDRDDEAREAIDAALGINPNLSISAMQRQFAGSNNDPENRRLWLESLSKAGLPS